MRRCVFIILCLCVISTLGCVSVKPVTAFEPIKVTIISTQKETFVSGDLIAASLYGDDRTLIIMISSAVVPQKKCPDIQINQKPVDVKSIKIEMR